ncbi:flagellar assembly peptidoglycan hydrolase FlgJ [Ideonella sp. BN130291]|uniref:flagellar assembly peptidoglycan hydrolase FlgJ n=1 Tax=Ideonella sp. BN130291 TaxID=3112940 RepID=UPI002E264F9D|nr:flagellar assembly peptidoglycan hydrolase FlgJ [Ideonella sp. BN130291]
MAVIPNRIPLQPALSADGRSVAQLKNQAGADPRSAVREAAKQFEGLFMQELMKSMRQSTMPSGFLDNEGSKLGSELLDTQLSNQISGLPGGLADVIARQLERQMGVPANPQLPASAAATTALRAGTPDTPQVRKAMGAAQGFVAQHQDAARAVEAQTGIPAGFLIAQAAHETGWGKRDIRHADGTPSHNLFGIKAGPGWKGAVAEVTTTEYINGQAHKVKAKFRAYESAEASFADYASLMKNNPRYERVIANADSARGFAQGLQRAGYATDPAYADKLTRVINTTLRLQRSLA